jgi:hypothetical protein
MFLTVLTNNEDMVVFPWGGSNKPSNITYQYAGGTTEETGLGSEDWDMYWDMYWYMYWDMYSIKYSTIQFMSSFKLLHVSAQWCHLQGIFHNNETQVQHANLGTDRPHWYHYYIKILGNIKSRSIHSERCDISTM